MGLAVEKFHCFPDELLERAKRSGQIEEIRAWFRLEEKDRAEADRTRGRKDSGAE